MGKVFGILLIVLGIYVGLEMFTKGTEGAFGGLLAPPAAATGAAPAPDAAGAGSPAARPRRSPLDAIRNRVNDDMALGAQRREAMDPE